ncbi:pyridoxamine 5'-phosphate oxidase [Myroides sp. LJL116]
MKDLSNYRQVYDKDILSESLAHKDALMQFRKWFVEVEQSHLEREVNAMHVSSIGLDGFPKTRVVLLKSYDENGFVFYTNYESEKSKAILANPHVCLSFFWPGMERQVIIKGLAKKVSASQSDNYFDSRPHGSKLGAIASNQSQVIESYQVLEDRLKQLEQENPQDIKRPDFWGGFCVEPISIEFWQGRPNRLHDRLRYRLSEDKLDWIVERLAP